MKTPTLLPLPTHVDETITDVTGARLLTLTLAPEHSLYVGRWYGTATPESIQLGMRAVLSFITRHPGLCCALSDGSRIQGDWVELMPWVNYEFLPAFLDLGIRAIAFVPSQDPGTRLGITTFSITARQELPVGVFETELAARRWLAQHTNK